MRVKEPQEDVRQVIKQVVNGFDRELLPIADRPIRLRQSRGLGKDLLRIAGKMRVGRHAVPLERHPVGTQVPHLDHIDVDRQRLGGLDGRLVIWPLLAEQQEVWRWSADRDVAQVDTERTFPPGVTLLDRVTWERRDASGVRLQPGVYQVQGSLATAPPQPGNVLLIELRGP